MADGGVPQTTARTKRDHVDHPGHGREGKGVAKNRVLTPETMEVAARHGAARGGGNRRWSAADVDAVKGRGRRDAATPGRTAWQRRRALRVAPSCRGDSGKEVWSSGNGAAKHGGASN